MPAEEHVWLSAGFMYGFKLGIKKISVFEWFWYFLACAGLYGRLLQRKIIRCIYVFKTTKNNLCGVGTCLLDILILFVFSNKVLLCKIGFLNEGEKTMIDYITSKEAG